jgi:hypothetical protein
MSLDVTLFKTNPACDCCGRGEEREVFYSSNITHNLNKMAEAAGIYMHLWQPEEIGITKAEELIGPLTEGLRLLKSDRAKFEAYNAANGFGLYVHFVPFVEKYLEACKQYPDAEVHACR